ncbi:hypothetical protein PV11_07348 [Exophiala sideris]|uniref:RNA helicase n=1 Tax=Exophiala sideris TaxID=1016849 RepID=A0A0D1YYB6_9EURO|nr:hypothetical protein PV11_07348 [Exophiala sideris]
MYGAARQGRLAIRALRSFRAPLTSSTLTRTSFPAVSSASFKPIRNSQFSSLSQLRQNAVAADMGAEDISHVQREFTTFSQLGENGVVDQRIIDNLKRRDIETMTDVQRMTINECLDGTDVVAQARTGTGKTLAFLMPIVQRMLKDPTIESKRPHISDTRALIISPTRELAEQIAEEARKLVHGTRLQVQTAVGGTQKSYHLKLMQRMGCHILVGTPGRVNDLLSDQHSGLTLDNIQTFVLDEADRLLNIGFSETIAAIQGYMPPEEVRDRQTLMFSATMPRSVVSLVKQSMRPDFKFVRTVDPADAATHEAVPQNVVFLPGLQNQIPAIAELAYKHIKANQEDPANNPPFKVIIFYPSINEVRLAYEILRNLRDPGQRGGFFSPHPLDPCKIVEMSSQLTQALRERNTKEFRNADSAILVASDVAARGMDFPNVSHVIQVGLPRDTEDYVHRLGRTGRAGKPGQGWLLLQDDERNAFRHLVNEIHAVNINQNTSLETAQLDMTQPSQLSAETGKIMRFVEMGVKATSMADKAKTYATLLSGMVQSRVSRSKQQIVDMANELSKFGWGLERPPQLTAQWVSKMGFGGVRNIEARQGTEDDFPPRGRGGDRRSSSRRDNFDENDPFGQGSSGGRGSFGGRESRGSFGGRDSRGSYGGRDSRGGGGGFGERRGGFSDRGDRGSRF